MSNVFDVSKRDAQATIIAPMATEKFDIARYADYEASLLEGNKAFFAGKTGIQVYRRVRADGVFFDACRDYKQSLALQLGALDKSLEFKADIANFLEPWYGIGYIASAFGSGYAWTPGQSPSVDRHFETMADVLAQDVVPLDKTPIGQYMLDTIEYFLDQTQGKIPMSYSDVQSPLNMLSYLMPITDLFMEIYDDPDSVVKVLDVITELLIDFLKKQANLIGDCLAKPGHGFGSSRGFSCMGMSADNVVMLSPAQYQDMFQGYDDKIGDAFGGLAFHSCGEWLMHAKMVNHFKTVKTIDGAFSPQTDPGFNSAKDWHDVFAGTGKILNTRCVGKPEEVLPYFKDMYGTGNDMRMIAVTYCETAAEQDALYAALHALEG